MFYKATHDFVYDKLHADIIKDVISGNKIKEISEDGKEIYYSFNHLRKFKDAALFAARRVKICPPDHYLVAMNLFVLGPCNGAMGTHTQCSTMFLVSVQWIVTS